MDALSPQSASSVAEAVPLSVSREGRQLVLRNLACVSSPECKLRYARSRSRTHTRAVHLTRVRRHLDNVPITNAELVEAAYGSMRPPVESADDFLEAVVLSRASRGETPDACLSLDLSGCALTRFHRHNVVRFSRVQTLNLAHNLLTDVQLSRAGLDTLPLVHLDVRSNKVCERGCLCAVTPPRTPPARCPPD